MFPSSLFTVTGPAAGNEQNLYRDQRTDRSQVFSRAVRKHAVLASYLAAYIIPVIVTLVFILIQTLQICDITSALSVRPRTAEGLVGVFFSCWVHWSWAHWASNILGWLGLSLGILYFGVSVLILSFCWIQVVSGFLVWIFGRSATHAGLSGVLCGYFGFLLVGISMERPMRVRTLAMTAIIMFLYFTMFVVTLFTIKPEVSFESHIYGFSSGIAFAYIFFKTHYRSFILQPLPKRRQITTTITPPSYIPGSGNTYMATSTPEGTEGSQTYGYDQGASLYKMPPPLLPKYTSKPITYAIDPSESDDDDFSDLPVRNEYSQNYRVYNTPGDDSQGGRDVVYGRRYILNNSSGGTDVSRGVNPADIASDRAVNGTDGSNERNSSDGI